MKRVVLLLILFQITLINKGQIIADHTIVADFDKIPSYYIAEVKKMMVSFPGESHSEAYRNGMELLEELYPAYSCNIGTGEAITDLYLRVNYGDNVGEAKWFTWYAYAVGSRPSASTYIKDLIKEYSDHGHPMSVIGFGWCWDMVGLATADGESDADPVYGCRYRGLSDGGPDGNLGWGLDADDYSLSGNRVCLDTYLQATEDYITFCKDYNTKVVFTTGTVDGGGGGYFRGEIGYQGYLKNERIRNYAKADASRILFDYADILCYDNDGKPSTTEWNGHTYPVCTPANEYPVTGGHISNEGAIRLAKAQWWMLARIAGWGGVTTSIPVTSITVTGAGEASTITTDIGTLQLGASVSPSNATNQTVTWSISNGTGEASISATGLVTAIINGTITAKATANDGSGVYGTLVFTISNQIIFVTTITVTGEGGATTITTDNGTLQLSAAITPVNATNQTVTWSIINGSGQASISASGLVTSIANGTVTADATANDGSGIIGSLVISILNQVTLVTSITITGEDGASTITEDNRTLQLIATILPVNATTQDVTWSISNGTGQASISETGLVTAIGSGKVTAKAIANDGSGAEGILEITIMRNFTEPLVVIVGENEIKIPLDEDFTDSKMCLYNLNGHLIDNKLIDSNITVFDTSSLCPGIYFVVLNNNAILKVGKLIIN